MNKTYKHTDSDLSLKLFAVLSRVIDMMECKLLKGLKDYGINLTEFGVLELLYHKGDQPIQKIGKKILIASSSITYVVDKLEKKKHVKRVACPTDRRITYAAITDEGRELMEEVFPKLQAFMVEMMRGLDVNEKEKMIEQLKRLGLFAKKYSFE
ncbi:MarR family transcriptional regulator [Oceanobacillus arenosus]|uniref:MarR family transcriptional regulator n=1 Tax=Oceanobacillus arenosus TaxID=1229153 RepID=A0A3D8PK83_9BACI|nr:MarR family transcriptional regulator [Oceanobacillus arenosus]RDW16082.1 MarR family transcriptional regulator [Oceanobacillus arenosus]